MLSFGRFALFCDWRNLLLAIAIHIAVFVNQEHAQAKADKLAHGSRHPHARQPKGIGEGNCQHDSQHHVSRDRDDGGHFAVGKRGKHAGRRDAKAIEEEAQRIDAQAFQDDLEQLGLLGLRDKNADERLCSQLADDDRRAVGHGQERQAITHKAAHHLMVLVAVVVAIDRRDAIAKADKHGRHDIAQVADDAVCRDAVFADEPQHGRVDDKAGNGHGHMV